MCLPRFASQVYTEEMEKALSNGKRKIFKDVGIEKQRAMKYNQKNEEAYQAVYQPLFDKLNSGKFFPNIQGIRKQIKELNHRMDILCTGVNFAKDFKEVEKVEERLDVLRGQKRAYQNILKYVNTRIKETELANK